jgi:hypothetical protein
LVSICKNIRKTYFWIEGWLAIRQILELDAISFNAEILAKLSAIEAELRPRDLVQKVRAVVFSTNAQGVDFEDVDFGNAQDIGTSLEETEALALNLGKFVAVEQATFTELLPELVARDGRLWFFGQGLFAGAADVLEIWNGLVAALSTTEETARRPNVLRGFLNKLAGVNPALAATLLDNAVEHKTLAGLYPLLQASFQIGAKDIERLKRSIALGRASAAMYKDLASAVDPIPAPELRELLSAIAAMPSGYNVAIEILYGRLHSDKDRGVEIAQELIEAGCFFIQQFPFTNSSQHEDYVLGELAKLCLKGEKGAAITIEFCRRFKCALANHETSAIYNNYLLAGFVNAQPLAFLDGLCGGNRMELELGVRILRDISYRKHPLRYISDENILNWCDQNPPARYPALAQVITTFESTKKTESPKWSTLVLRFLEKAPDPSEIFLIFVSQFMFDDEGAGSFATNLELKKPLLDQLEAYPSLKVAINTAKEKLSQRIDEERRRETEWSRHENERFE